jgi:hypothetical protein
MNTYRIDPVGNHFEVIETAPDKAETVVSTFPTEAAASEWLHSYLLKLNWGNAPDFV